MGNTYADLNVVLVEPSAMQARSVVKAFNDIGITRLRVADSAAAAFALMHEARPDLVVGALYLPDMSGTDLVLAMHKDRDFEGIPFILVSSETRQESLDAARQAGICALLPKPFTDMGATLKWVMTGRLRKAGVKFYMESTISEVHDGNVIVKHETTAEIENGGVIINSDDQQTRIPAKSLIFAVGYVSESGVFERIKASGLPYYQVGDAKRTRNLRDAIVEGYMAGTEWVDSL